MEYGKKSPCFLCKKMTADSKDDYCSGCECWICEPCCTNPNVPWGSHDPEDHSEDHVTGTVKQK